MKGIWEQYYKGVNASSFRNSPPAFGIHASV